jgi:hypothetical protein
LIQQLMAQATDPTQAQALIDQIMTRGAINFAPVLGEQTASGGYNSTTAQLLQNDARARATAESAKAVSDARLQAEQLATTLQSAKLQTNRTQTTQPQTSLGQIAKTVALAIGANKLVGAGLKGLEGPAAAKIPGSSPNVYDYSTTPEGAAAQDFGTGPFAPLNVGGAVSGGVSGTGTAFDSAISSDIGTGLLNQADVASILANGSVAAAGNPAFLSSATDASVANPVLAAATVPGAVAPTPVGTTGAGSDVLSAASSASALGGGEAAGEVAGTAAAAPAASEAAGGLGTAGTALATEAFPAYVTGQIATSIAGDVAGGLSGFLPSLNDFAGGFVQDVGGLFGF